MEGFNETDLGNAVEELIVNVLSRKMHTAMPGRVEEVYTDGGVRFVEVIPLLRHALMDGTQSEIKRPLGVLLLTIGSSASSVLIPVKKGDLVLLVFSERALEHWKQNTEVADSIYGRQFDLSDAFAIPFNFKGLQTGYNNEDMVIEHNGQTVTIKQSGNMEINSTGTVKINGENILIDSSALGTIKIGGETLTEILDGVVTRRCICSFTGAGHPDSSGKVMAGK